MAKVVLCIEDESHIREIIEDYVSSAGFKFACAATVEDAKKVYEQNKGNIFCTLLDYQLPDGNGLEVCQHMVDKEYDGKFIFVSAWENKDIIPTEVSDRVSAHIRKPFNFEQLVKEIKSAA